MSLGSHVALNIKAFLREFWQSDLELLLYAGQDLLICFRADKADSDTLCSETTGTTDTVEVAVCVCWQVIIDGQIDALDIDTTTKDIGRDTDTLLEFLESLVPLDTAIDMLVGVMTG